MAKALFEFRCMTCGETHERYIRATELESECPSCSHVAIKAIGAPRHLKVDGFPAGIMGDRWAKTREDNSKRKWANNGT